MKLSRIIIADDHALVRGGLAQLIRLIDDNVEIIETNDLDETIRLLESSVQSVNLLMMDLVMPGMDDSNAISKISKKFPSIPIIVVSVRENISSIRNALSAGAMGYIPKSSSPEVMISALKLVLSGGVYVPPHILTENFSDNNEIQQFTLENNLSNNKSSLLSNYLTERQLEVLALMSEGKSNKDIADELGLTIGTIKMHSSRIFKALNVQNRTEAVTKFSKHIVSD
ncbi:MAG: response regulator transcription factor [Pseudomonadota bacterium]